MSTAVSVPSVDLWDVALWPFKVYAFLLRVSEISELFFHCRLFRYSCMNPSTDQKKSAFNQLTYFSVCDWQVLVFSYPRCIVHDDSYNLI